LLIDFHNKLREPGWTFSECGEAHEKELLQHFDRIIAVHHTLPQGCQQVIADICRRMGKGMSEFAQKSVETKADYDLYCHYVAGLVGIGLSKLFALSKLEDESYFEKESISNNMGLFLQKTNIIRDYLDDIKHARVFWPREVWRKYTADFAAFQLPANSRAAVFCLNELITDALLLIPDCLTYLSGLHNQQVFNFCAIPQVMAIATLALCYSNPDVFTSVVKIRRGLAAKLVAQSANMEAVYYYFNAFLNVIEAKLLSDDPNRDATVKAIAAAKSRIPAHVQHSWQLSMPNLLALAAFATVSAYLIYQHRAGSAKV